MLPSEWGAGGLGGVVSYSFEILCQRLQSLVFGIQPKALSYLLVCFTLGKPKRSKGAVCLIPSGPLKDSPGSSHIPPS